MNLASAYIVLFSHWSLVRVSLGTVKMISYSSLLKPILKVLIIGVVIFFILNLSARTSGIGYTSTFESVSTETFSFGRTHSIGYHSSVYLEVFYNPVLFPISHLLGYGRYSGITWVVHYPEEDMGQIAALIRVREEVSRNIPYLLTVSFAVALVLEESIFHLMKLSRKRNVKSFYPETGLERFSRQ